MGKIDDLLAAEGAAAEQYELPEQLPAHVEVSRPGLPRHGGVGGECDEGTESP